MIEYIYFSLEMRGFFLTFAALLKKRKERVGIPQTLGISCLGEREEGVNWGLEKEAM